MFSLKFIPGLIIVQLAAGAIALVAAEANGRINWPLTAVGVATLTVVVGLWFGSIAEHLKKDALAGLRDNFARDRENLLISVEAEKRSILEEGHRRLVAESRRAYGRANFKLGVAVATMLGVAGGLLYVELVTLALITATTAGGALAGYLVRARQDARALRQHTTRTLNPSPESAAGELLEYRPTRTLGGRHAQRPP